MKRTMTGLRVRRDRAGLSQERLARAADCSTSLVGMVERGYVCGPEVAARIAAALDCEVADLFERLVVRAEPADA